MKVVKVSLYNVSFYLFLKTKKYLLFCCGVFLFVYFCSVISFYLFCVFEKRILNKRKRNNLLAHESMLKQRNRKAGCDIYH